MKNIDSIKQALQLTSGMLIDDLYPDAEPVPFDTFLVISINGKYSIAPIVKDPTSNIQECILRPIYFKDGHLHLSKISEGRFINFRDTLDSAARVINLNKESNMIEIIEIFRIKKEGINFIDKVDKADLRIFKINDQVTLTNLEILIKANPASRIVQLDVEKQIVVVNTKEYKIAMNNGTEKNADKIIQSIKIGLFNGTIVKI